MEEMSASVAGDQEASLKRLLGEDEQVMKRREVLTHKLEVRGWGAGAQQNWCLKELLRLIAA